MVQRLDGFESLDAGVTNGTTCNPHFLSGFYWCVPGISREYCSSARAGCSAPGTARPGTDGQQVQPEEHPGNRSTTVADGSRSRRSRALRVARESSVRSSSRAPPVRRRTEPGRFPPRRCRGRCPKTVRKVTVSKSRNPLEKRFARTWTCRTGARDAGFRSPQHGIRGEWPITGMKRCISP